MVNPKCVGHFVSLKHQYYEGAQHSSVFSMLLFFVSLSRMCIFLTEVGASVCHWSLSESVKADSRCEDGFVKT